MAANVKNIIVGAAQLFMSTTSGSARPSTAVGSTGLNWGSQKASGYLNASSSWRDLVYTTTGLEVSYEPGYGEVMFKELLDAARLFKQTVKVMLKTELTEATLENLHVVFGQADTYITYSGSVGSSNTTLTVASNSTAGASN